MAYFVFVTVTFIATDRGWRVCAAAARVARCPSTLTPGYPVTPAIFLVLVVLLLVLLVMHSPAQAMAGDGRRGGWDCRCTRCWSVAEIGTVPQEVRGTVHIVP